MTTDITELAQSEINNALAQLKQISEYPTPSTQYARVLRKYIATLVEALEKAQRANGYLREQSAEWERKAISNFEDCAEMSARVEELESQRKLAFTASNRWADKFREAEKRIAELEFRSVTVKLPDINEYLAEVHDKTLNRAFRLLAEGVRAGDVAAMRAAGIKVEVE